MNGRGEGGEEAQLPPALESLEPVECLVLAALAAVGQSSLSAGELASLTEVEDVRPIVAELERRGLLRAEEPERYALPPGLAAKLRRAWDIVDTADRVLRQFVSIAEDGKLTMSDLDAVLGIADWAAQAGRWAEVLRLVKAAETALSLTRRVEAWVELLERGRAAARALGDRDAESWVEERLRSCERALERAGGGPRTSLRRGDLRPRARPSFAKMLVGAVVLAVTAGAGFGVGYGVAGGSETVTTVEGGTVTLPGTTVALPGETVTRAGETVTLPGETVTQPGTTVTLPAETVTPPPATTTAVITETVTTTVVVTETVTTTVSGPG